MTLAGGVDIEFWLTPPVEEALKLQRLLPKGLLRVIARGRKNNGAR